MQREESLQENTPQKRVKLNSRGPYSKISIKGLGRSSAALRKAQSQRMSRRGMTFLKEHDLKDP